MHARQAAAQPRQILRDLTNTSGLGAAREGARKPAAAGKSSHHVQTVAGGVDLAAAELAAAGANLNPSPHRSRQQHQHQQTKLASSPAHPQQQQQQQQQQRSRPSSQPHQLQGASRQRTQSSDSSKPHAGTVSDASSTRTEGSSRSSSQEDRQEEDGQEATDACDSMSFASWQNSSHGSSDGRSGSSSNGSGSGGRGRINRSDSMLSTSSISSLSSSTSSASPTSFTAVSRRGDGDKNSSSKSSGSSRSGSDKHNALTILDGSEHEDADQDDTITDDHHHHRLEEPRRHSLQIHCDETDLGGGINPIVINLADDDNEKENAPPTRTRAAAPPHAVVKSSLSQTFSAAPHTSRLANDFASQATLPAGLEASQAENSSSLKNVKNECLPPQGHTFLLSIAPSSQGAAKNDTKTLGTANRCRINPPFGELWTLASQMQGDASRGGQPNLFMPNIQISIKRKTDFDLELASKRSKARAAKDDHENSENEPPRQVSTTIMETEENGIQLLTRTTKLATGPHATKSNASAIGGPSSLVSQRPSAIQRLQRQQSDVRHEVDGSVSVSRASSSVSAISCAASDASTSSTASAAAASAAPEIGAGVSTLRAREASVAADRDSSFLASQLSKIRESPEYLEEPFAGIDYASDIFTYLKSIEGRNRPKTNYMHRQKEINANMRAILIDWLVEVIEDFRLASETLYLAVSYLDRFLSKVRITAKYLQLLGVSCLLIASKFEEIYPLKVRELITVTDYSFTKQEICTMERQVLDAMQFDIAMATTRSFGAKILASLICDEKTTYFAYYLMELSLLDYQCLKYLPSELAASATMLSLLTFNKKLSLETVEKATGYPMTALEACISHLHAVHIAASVSTLKGVREKYGQFKFCFVSKTVLPRLSFPWT